MLIVAIPKSASTSLLKTLGNLHKLEAIQDFSIKNQDIPKQSNVIHNVHSDIRELNNANVSEFSKDGIFYKQHVFPSDNNLKLLRDKKKVILLRDSKQILLAYKRGAKKRHNGLPKNYSTSISNKQLIKMAANDGFLYDIDFFNNKWKEEGNSKNTLIIYYNDYIKKTKKTINKIECFFNLPVTNSKIKPVRARYSRTNLLRRKFYRLKQFIKKLIKVK